MTKVKTSLTVDRELWIRFRVEALKRGLDANDLLVQLIKKFLEEAGGGGRDRDKDVDPF